MSKADVKKDEIYKYLVEYIELHSFPPSYREIASALNIKSTNSIKNYLDRLEAENLIRRSDAKNRSIEIVRNSSNTNNVVKIPLIGKVAAGKPILTLEDFEDEYVFSKSIFGTNQDLFMLKISGDSMIDVGIDDGDFVVVKKQNTAENGEIVVAYIDGYSTVKTFYRTGTKIILQPQNSLYKPLTPNKCVILGKVVGAIKRFY